MKIAFAALALGAFAITASSSTSATADEPLESRVSIESKLDAKAGKVNITLKGKDAAVYINTDYSLKCDLKVADGGKLDKAQVVKADAKFEDSGKTGKAKSATFSVTADKAVSGECKLVACTDSSCSSPFKQSFTGN